MENSEAVRDLKTAVTTAKEAYLASPNVPASKTQLPILEEKIAICQSRLSELEGENDNQSKNKDKAENDNQSKNKGKGRAT
jgi:hypothetical protein